MEASYNQKYEGLRQSEDSGDGQTPIILRQSALFTYAGWGVASIFAFISLSLLLWNPRIPDNKHGGTFDTGFETEFQPAKPYISKELKQFWGGPRWYDNGTTYHLANPSEPTYVGPPNKEMDNAWHTLTKGRYFNITEEEAESFFGKPHGLYNHEGLGYLVGFDGMHALHCVDQLRKALDRDHYFNKETNMAYPDRGHRDHCLDHIRQQLMCHADLTPIPVIWYKGIHRSFVQSDVVHTCRDWSGVEAYMKTRREPGDTSDHGE